MQIPFRKQFDALFRSDSSMWLKIGGGILVGLLVAFRCITHTANKAEQRSILERESLIPLLVIGASGGLVGFLLSVKDHVKRRLARGERVNLLVRAYFGMGKLSFLLWCPTAIFLAIVIIILTY